MSPCDTDRDAPTSGDGRDRVDLRRQRARLRVGERLAVGEPELRRCDWISSFHSLRAARPRERASGPRAGVHLDQAVARHDVEAVARRERRHGLHAPFERARVDGRRGGPRRTVRERLGLRAPAVVELHAGRPAVERLAGVAVSPCRIRKRVVIGPAAYAGQPVSAPTGGSPPASGPRTSIPAPSSLSTVTVPPWFSATWRTIARPSPVPPVSRDRARSTAVEALEHAGEIFDGIPTPRCRARRTTTDPIVRRHRTRPRCRPPSCSGSRCRTRLRISRERSRAEPRTAGTGATRTSMREPRLDRALLEP